MGGRNDSPRDLGHIQQWMQAVIMHAVGVAEGLQSLDARRHIDVDAQNLDRVVTRSRSQTAQERLAIYNHAYYARLLECLRGEFPVLMHALGEELFDAFAVGYLQAYPSQSYTLGRLGARFPQHLAETRPSSDEGDDLPADWPVFLIDLALLEWNFNEVFDGPGVEGQPMLDPAALSRLTPARLAAGCLIAAPCLRLLALRYPVHKYYVAVRRENDPLVPEPRETFLAVTRRDYVVRHYELSRPAYELLRSLLSGDSIGDAIDHAAQRAGPELDRLEKNLYRWFYDWAAEGFFCQIRFDVNSELRIP